MDVPRAENGCLKSGRIGIGRSSESTQRRETIIFLTPHIVAGDEMADAGVYSTPTGVGGDKELKGLR
jgi:hypothetical protein